jgi:hypothetical protein
MRFTRFPRGETSPTTQISEPLETFMIVIAISCDMSHYLGYNES